MADSSDFFGIDLNSFKAPTSNVSLPSVAGGNASPPASVAGLSPNLTGSPAPTSTPFDENILGNFRNPTYHLTFYSAGESMNGQRVVIAESGVTGYNIRDCEIVSYVGSSSQFRNTTAVSARLTITEPLGTSFLDAMLVVAGSGNVKNWTHAPYLLDVTFKGYNEDGSPNPNLCQNYPNGGRWTYQLQITEVDVKLDATGGTYVLNCKLIHMVALEDKLLRIRQAMNIPAKTLGEFTKDFAAQLSKTIGGGANTFTINLMPTGSPSAKLQNPSEFKFIQDGEDKKEPYQSRGMKEQFKTDWTGRVPANASVLEIIQSAIGGTEEGQTLARDYAGRVSTDKPFGDGTGNYREMGYLRIYPQVSIKGYDSKLQDYTYNITLNVKMYQQHNTVLDGREFQNEANGQAAIQSLQQRQAIQKRYEYIFTGKNTEITNLDLSFKFYNILKLPAQMGALNYPENYSVQAQYNNQARQQVQTAKQEAASGNTGQSPTQVTSEANPANQNLQTPTDSTSTAGTTVAGPTLYAEDLLENGTATNALPVTTGVVGVNESRWGAGPGIQSQWHRGRSIFGALLDQAETAALNVIRMEIKGDPFWLGLDYGQSIQSTQDIIGQSQGPTNAPSPQMPGGKLPNFMKGDQAFILYFRYPYNWGETGFYQFRDNDVFNGVYRAQTITSTFASGVFKQTIDAQRINLIGAKDAVALAGPQASPSPDSIQNPTVTSPNPNPQTDPPTPDAPGNSTPATATPANTNGSTGAPEA